MKYNQQTENNTNKIQILDHMEIEEMLEQEFLMNCNPMAECEELIRREQEGEEI